MVNKDSIGFVLLFYQNGDDQGEPLEIIYRDASEGQEDANDAKKAGINADGIVISWNPEFQVLADSLSNVDNLLLLRTMIGSKSNAKN